MGRIPSEPQTPTTVTHFSHPHPLTLTITDHHHHQQQTLISSSSSSCSGCNLRLSGTFYSCKACNFFLHKKCFDMPVRITHPFHKEHALTLLPEPTYDDGLFRCDACGGAGKGFSYHCKPCGVDLHVLCAAVPLTLTCASHHMHKLDLTLESPYGTKDFSCDICQKPGGDHWLYRCNPCGFDAHLSCARGAPPASPTNFMGFQSHAPSPQQFAAVSRSAPVPPHFGAGTPPPPVQQNFGPPPVMNNIPAVGIPAGGPMINPHLAARNEYLASYNAMIQQIMNNSNATMGRQATGGVGSERVQQVMQMIAAINNGGGGGGGIQGMNAFGGDGGGIPGMNAFGGGGGGIPGVNAFSGGGGGGQDLLQTLMNGGGGGGGGGGLGSLQSLLGGGNGLDLLGGGGGGFDLLGALGGLMG